MRWLIITGLALLITVMGCPAADNQDQRSTSAGTTDPSIPADPIVEVAYPAAALNYVVAGLEQPVEDGRPALGPLWLTIARLQYADVAPAAAPLRSVVEAQRNQAGDQLLPGLCAAWLAVDPEPALDYLTGLLADGKYEYYDCLRHDPVRGTACLARLDPAGMEETAALRYLLLIRHWGGPGEELIPALEFLTTHDAEPVRLLAAGMLLATPAGTAEHRELIAAAVDDYTRLSNVAEAVKLSRDPELADDLVNLAAQAEMGEVDPEFHQHRVSLTAYALTTLPGGQAELMRNKLLGARDGYVRWEARLGQLLNGKPDTWDAAVDDESISDSYLWITLQPEDIAGPDLLPTLARAARNEDAGLRLQAALHLNRYGEYASENRVRQILEKLIDDPVDEVRAAAWYSAGSVGLGGLDDAALAVLEAGELPPEVRLAASFYLLRLAEQNATGGDAE